MTQKLSVVQESLSFIQKKGSFDNVVKKLSKASVSAIEMLESIMETTQDEKLKVTCATKLLEFYISSEDKKNTDALTRMVAEYKYVGKPADSITVSRQPMIDFHNIAEVS